MTTGNVIVWRAWNNLMERLGTSVGTAAQARSINRV